MIFGSFLSLSCTFSPAMGLETLEARETTELTTLEFVLPLVNLEVLAQPRYV
jgi:hypothetical protein